MVATLSLSPCLIDTVMRASLALFHSVVAGLNSPWVGVIWLHLEPKSQHLNELPLVVFTDKAQQRWLGHDYLTPKYSSKVSQFLDSYTGDV